jgi:hypothetical protein
VARERVRNLMSHNHSDASIILGDRHYTFPESHLPAGQAECVHFFTLEDFKFPLTFRMERKFGVWCLAESDAFLTVPNGA